MSTNAESGTKSSVLSSGVKTCGAGFPFLGIGFGLLVLWAALFHLKGNSTLGYIKSHSLFVWWYDVMTQSVKGQGLSALLSGEDALGWFIPLIVIGLLYWRFDDLKAIEKKPSWLGVAVLCFAVLLHICGFLVQQTRISIVAFFIGVYGITGLIWGRLWMREVLFVFALFLFCVPFGGASDIIAFPLRMWSTTLSVKIASGLFGLDIIQQGTLIFDPAGRYQYEVAPACGGIRSLTAIFVLSLCCGFIFFKSIWKKVVLVVLALPLAVAGNILRLLAIIFAAELAGQQAGASVHNSSIFSLLPYLPAFIGFWILTYWLGDETKRKENPNNLNV